MGCKLIEKSKEIIQNLEKIEEKTEAIKFRLSKEKKNNWKKICEEKQITLTSLIIDSVENRILDNERKEILAFIEKQDNLFVKIETNINQVARIANGQKFISEIELGKFSKKLAEIVQLKKEQNKIFSKIYSMLAK
jgi:alanyl-tRNA synthetase